MAKPSVSVSESTIFRIFLLVWIGCTLIGGVFIFPFGFIFMGIFGFFFGIFVVVLYVNTMGLLFGDKSNIDGGGRKFDFFRNKYKREGEED